MTTETIDAQPLTLPRDAKPSELVRSLAPEHWRRDGCKRIMPDGRIQWCAAGIIAEHMGALWSPEPEMEAAMTEDGCIVLVTEVVPDVDTWMRLRELLNGGASQDGARLRCLAMINDERGKDAAADYLESLGL